MPELPEVETVRRGLEPAMLGARFERVILNRKDLRFALPKNFAGRLRQARIETMDRRGKYLLVALSTGETLIMHLGMSGRFTVRPQDENEDAHAPGVFHHGGETDPAHDHVVFHVAGAPKPENAARIVYNDPRRFGFMDLVPSDALETCKHFKAMGPEPLSNAFSEEAFSIALKGRAAPIKAALLDQKIVAGIGNIYACEALYRAGVSPRRKAETVAGARARRLHGALRDVLAEAIDAGGSSLRDFAGASGDLGYFQHRFAVYDREGAPCSQCSAPIKRIVQSGRSTFFCGSCQR